MREILGGGGTILDEAERACRLVVGQCGDPSVIATPLDGSFLREHGRVDKTQECKNTSGVVQSDHVPLHICGSVLFFGVGWGFRSLLPCAESKIDFH